MFAKVSHDSEKTDLAPTLSLQMGNWDPEGRVGSTWCCFCWELSLLMESGRDPERKAVGPGDPGGQRTGKERTGVMRDSGGAGFGAPRSGRARMRDSGCRSHLPSPLRLVLHRELSQDTAK